MKPAAVVGSLAVLAVSLAGCGGKGSGPPPPPPSAQRTSTSPAATLGADHECVESGSGPAPEVAWAQLRNPILSEPDAGVKDQALVWADGAWHMLFSYVTNDVPTAGAEHWDIASATSADLEQWSAPAPWPAQAGVLGVASPDIVRSPTGVFVATYDSDPGGTDGSQSKLYYRTSTDLETWSAPQPLALSLHPAPGDRMIDPALAWTDHGLILGYKYGTTSSSSSGASSSGASSSGASSSGASSSQHFEIAWSPSGSLAGPWKYLGRPDIVVNGDTVENFEFVAVAGRWHLVATSNTFDQPWMFELSGDPDTPSSWLHWTRGRMLVIPGQSWDSGPGVSSVGFEHANSVFLCDANQDDTGSGYYYVTYSGSDELTAVRGLGARRDRHRPQHGPGALAGPRVAHRRRHPHRLRRCRRAPTTVRRTRKPRRRATRARPRTRRARAGPAAPSEA